MNEQLFRKKSIDRVSSPEQLDAYIRVASPGVWLVLMAIVALLVGVCVWGVLGRLDTTVSAVAVCEEGAVGLYVKEGQQTGLQPGMEVQIGGKSCIITEIAPMPEAAGRILSDYALHVGGLSAEDWVYSLGTDAQLSDGVYSAEILVESVSPISFVVN